MKRSDEVKLIAKERIETLFKEASMTNDQTLRNRYVELARKLVQKANIRMPREFKRKYCKHCYSYFNSKNSRVRTTKHKMISTLCFECKKRTRFPYLKKK